MSDIVSLKISADRAERQLADQIDRISRWGADPMSKAIDTLIDAKIAVAIAALQSGAPQSVAVAASPVAIWHDGDARAYYEASPDEQQAWNTYANREMASFDLGFDAGEPVFIDRDGKLTDWSPPTYFPEWLAEHRSAKTSSTEKDSQIG